MTYQKKVINDTSVKKDHFRGRSPRSGKSPKILASKKKLLVQIFKFKNLYTEMTALQKYSEWCCQILILEYKVGKLLGLQRNSKQISEF